MTMRGPEPGWYLDPQDSELERWWDGSAWGEQARRSSPKPPPVHLNPQPSQVSSPPTEEAYTTEIDSTYLKNQTSLIVYVWGVFQVALVLVNLWVFMSILNEDYVSSIGLTIYVLAPIGSSVMAAATVWWLAKQLENVGFKNPNVPAHSVWWTGFLLVIPWYFSMISLNNHINRTMTQHLPKNISTGPVKSVHAAVSMHLIALVLFVISRRASVLEYGENIPEVALSLALCLVAVSGFLLLSSGGLGRCLAAVINVGEILDTEVEYIFTQSELSSTNKKQIISEALNAKSIEYYWENATLVVSKRDEAEVDFIVESQTVIKP